MGAAHDVSSLRDEEPAPEPTDQWNARLPVRVIDYIRDEAKRLGRTQVKLVTDALDLDKDLAQRLLQQRERLKAYARSRSLTLSKDLPQVLAELVIAGLDCIEKKPKP